MFARTSFVRNQCCWHFVFCKTIEHHGIWGQTTISLKKWSVPGFPEQPGREQGSVGLSEASEQACLPGRVAFAVAAVGISFPAKPFERQISSCAFSTTSGWVIAFHPERQAVTTCRVTGCFPAGSVELFLIELTYLYTRVVVIVNASSSVENFDFVHKINCLRYFFLAGQCLYRTCTEIGQKIGKP
jgi:hypothetical protein